MKSILILIVVPMFFLACQKKSNDRNTGLYNGRYNNQYGYNQGYNNGYTGYNNYGNNGAYYPPYSQTTGCNGGLNNGTTSGSYYPVYINGQYQCWQSSTLGYYSSSYGVNPYYNNFSWGYSPVYYGGTGSDCDGKDVAVRMIGGEVVGQVLGANNGVGALTGAVSCLFF